MAGKEQTKGLKRPEEGQTNVAQGRNPQDKLERTCERAKIVILQQIPSESRDQICTNLRGNRKSEGRKNELRELAPLYEASCTIKTEPKSR